MKKIKRNLLLLMVAWNLAVIGDFIFVDSFTKTTNLIFLALGGLLVIWFGIKELKKANIF